MKYKYNTYNQHYGVTLTSHLCVSACFHTAIFLQLPTNFERAPTPPLEV